MTFIYLTEWTLDQQLSEPLRKCFLYSTYIKYWVLGQVGTYRNIFVVLLFWGHWSVWHF
jgi:hypothetical protein